jgi:hypothetical protein
MHIMSFPMKAIHFGNIKLLINFTCRLQLNENDNCVIPKDYGSLVTSTLANYYVTSSLCNC